MIRPIYATLNAAAPAVLPTLARFLFAAVLFRYFWASALTKFDGLGLDANAFIQIFPRAMDAAGYDPSQLSSLQHLIVWAGSVSEIILPILLVVGLFTRPAALGMIGFIIVQSLTDLYGHGVDAVTFGAWFDRNSAALIMDQRGMWIGVLMILVMLGAGPLSIDRVFDHKTAVRT